MYIPSSLFNIISLAIIIICFINVIIGYKKGFIFQLLTLLSFLGAFIVAYLCAPIFSNHIVLFKVGTTVVDEITSHLLNYFIWFVLILIVTKIVFDIIIQFSKAVSKIPLIGFANKLAGSIFGLFNSFIWIMVISAFLLTPIFKNGQEIRDNTVLKPFNEVTNKVIVEVGSKIDFDRLKIEIDQTEVDAVRGKIEGWLVENGILNEEMK